MAKKEINNEKTKNNLVKDVKAELKKVTWPTLKKLVSNTSAVISIVLIVAIIVFIFDLCFENLNEFGIEKLKSVVSSDEEIVENDTSDIDENAVDMIETEYNSETSEDGQNLNVETETSPEEVVQ